MAALCVHVCGAPAQIIHSATLWISSLTPVNACQSSKAALAFRAHGNGRTYVYTLHCLANFARQSHKCSCIWRLQSCDCIHSSRSSSSSNSSPDSHPHGSETHFSRLCGHHNSPSPVWLLVERPVRTSYMQAQQMIMILLRMLVIVSTPPHQATHYDSACLLS